MEVKLGLLIEVVVLLALVDQLLLDIGGGLPVQCSLGCYCPAKLFFVSTVGLSILCVEVGVVYRALYHLRTNVLHRFYINFTLVVDVILVESPV